MTSFMYHINRPTELSISTFHFTYFMYLMNAYSAILFCILISVSLSTAKILGNETDRVALVAIKSQISLDPLGVMSTWNDSRHFCQWEGVQCSHRHQRVTSLDLESNGLVGKISPHIGNLSFLRTLRLSNNNFQGEIPHELGQLFRLEGLYLSNNSLVGEIPGNISFCFNLKYFFLTFNSVVGKIPKELGSLSKLVKLGFHSNKLSGEIPPFLGNLTSLESLSLSANSFQGEIPKELGQLFLLEFLDLSNNSLVGNIPNNISLCSNLLVLASSRNNLVGRIPMELGSLSKLVTLALQNNMITGGIPPFLANLTSLETLSVSENSFGGSIPNTLGQLKTLKNLALGFCKLSGTFPPSIYNLSTLEIISIEYNQLSGHLPPDIGLMLPNLQLFFIEGNRFSGPIPTTLFNASRLQMIDIGTNHFTGKVPPNVGNLKDLTYLNLVKNQLGNGGSGDLDFFTSLANCSNLQLLSLASNIFGGMLPGSIANLSNQLSILSLDENQISGNIPTAIENLQSLASLHLTSNLITGSIPTTIGNLQNLGILDLHGNHLSGHIPWTIKNMSQLYSLDLSHNIMEGSIASSVENPILQTLDLSYNKFAGPIWKHKIGVSSRLINLTLAHNLLSGSIPSDIGNMKNLDHLDISENKMMVQIPSSIGSCLSLEYIYFQGNFLQGPLPSTLSSLKSLQILDVSRNSISGEIPKELEKLSFLRSLNLSCNNIEGKVPIKGIFQNASAFSVSENQKICGGIPKLGLHKCQDEKPKKQGVHFSLNVILGVVIPLFVITLLFLVLYLRSRPKSKPHSENDLGDLRRVSYNDLHKATNGFSSENLIGMGSYGSVYKATLHQDEGPIAVKVFNLMKHGGSKSFIAECKALNEVRHRNLLKIVTVCSSVNFYGQDFKALLFEFMPNGSLERWLHPSSNGQHPPRSLNLYQRLNIATDVASSLDYLHNHCERPIVHCDLKPSNVLLGNDMTARVGDFGLAKFVAKSTSSLKQDQTNSIVIRGTVGYIPPEYGMGAEVSTQGDVYSYGILLLEMFTGKRPTDHIFNDGLSIHNFCKVVSPQQVMDIIDMCMLSEETHTEGIMSNTQLEKCLSSIIQIGVACSVEQMAERMNIQDVLKKLHLIKQVNFSGLIPMDKDEVLFIEP